MDIKTILRSAAQQTKTQGVSATFRSLLRRAHVRWAEWHYGIRTDAVIDLSELGLSKEGRKEYTPTDYFDFRTMMRALAIDPRDHVFFDYGAGMGRAMILAACYPFRRVLGVEIAADLTKMAKDNISRARHRLQCQDIDIATCDAALYDIPHEVTLFYFNNPFYGAILTTVLNKIRSFTAFSPQPVLIVCNLPARSAFEEQILKQKWLEQKNDILLQSDRHCLIFVGAPCPA
jgi:16S rRNA G966 N2-methylase RsmD